MSTLYRGLALGILGVSALLTGCAPLDESAGQVCTARNAAAAVDGLGVGGSASIDGKVAQSFTAEESATFSSLTLPLLAIVPDNVSQGFNLTLKIETDLGGSTATTPSTPSGAVLATQTVAASALGLSNAFETAVDFTFSPVAVTSGVIYWIVLETSAVPSSNNFVAWLGSDTDAYTAGKALQWHEINFNWTSNVVSSRMDLNFLINCR